MRLGRLWASFLLAAAGAGPAPAWCASVVNSKHDLSSGSATTGPKSTTVNEVCVFCHTAHRPGASVPLWNKTQTAQNFTFYSSNYVNNYLGMAAPTMSALDGTRTKLCLSCHDGVTALGGVYNLGGAAATIAMSAATVTGKSNLGTNLATSHPILYDVKPGAGPPTAPGTDPEIRLPPGGDAVKVYGATNRVECTSCHSAHDPQFGDFLVKSNANAALCTTCHQKSGFAASAHATSLVSYTPPGGTATTVSEYSCRNCHSAHNTSAAQAYNLRGAEEATCFQCHGNPALTGTTNIQSQYLKAYSHPTTTVSGKHLDPETDGSNFAYSPTNRRHAECQDCHDPHESQSGKHVAPGNLISKALLGQWGVEPAYGATSWVPASSYARQVFANTTGYKEYQLCLKCHSSYAYGATPPLNMTDQSIELNPNNKSAHPVTAGLNSRAGSSAPKALTAATLSAPWAAAPGTQTMYCSDCHGSDLTTDPEGPHGSAGAHIVSGPNVYWPAKSTGALYTLDDLPPGNAGSANNAAGLMCLNCHPMYSGTTYLNNVHQEHSTRTQGVSPPCVACHVVIPHGAKRSRLIGYSSEAAPYNYGGAGLNALVLSGFKKAATPNGYSQSNCYSTNASCGAHSGNAGGYDP